jgi:23S rRNA maturation-related 3'-5' exoribonuclease YhaM
MVYIIEEKLNMSSRNLIEYNRIEIKSLLLETKRKGIDNVIQYLEESGFYEAPSSVCRHHNWKGGLAEHCLGVYKIASDLNDGLPHDSIVIAGILHDICKASKLYYDADGNIQRRHTHLKGHGRCSVKLLEKCGLLLTEDERLAIRWHMGGHHASLEERNEVELARNNPLWILIHKADKLDASGKSWK